LAYLEEASQRIGKYWILKGREILGGAVDTGGGGKKGLEGLECT
jgi:hypothetical protein